jgi:primary-amine oxidase
VTLERAVGIYERDGGLLWKHYDTYSKQNQSRRARQLVVFFIATIGNYDYAIHWIFHQDGALEVDAALTGIMLPKGATETTAAGHDAGFPSGHLVSANVVAPHHQHFFNFRLDLDVDGPTNPAGSRTTSRSSTRMSWSGTLIPGGFFSRNPALDVPACLTPAACP